MERQLLSHATCTIHDASAQIFVNFDTHVHTVFCYNNFRKIYIFDLLAQHVYQMKAENILILYLVSHVTGSSS